MENGYRLSFRRGDLFAIALVVLIALGTAFGFMPRGSAADKCIAQVYQDGVLIMELPLDTDAAVMIGGKYQNEVTVMSGSVAITSSDCPGADCVHSGRITAPGRSIVCLPNRVEIRITGEADVDFVVR